MVVHERSALTDGDSQRTSESNPSIVDGKCKTTDAEQAILAIQLVTMTGGVDHIAVFGDNGDSSVRGHIQDFARRDVLALLLVKRPFFLLFVIHAEKYREG